MMTVATVSRGKDIVTKLSALSALYSNFHVVMKLSWSFVCDPSNWTDALRAPVHLAYAVQVVLL